MWGWCRSKSVQVGGTYSPYTNTDHQIHEPTVFDKNRRCAIDKIGPVGRPKKVTMMINPAGSDNHEAVERGFARLDVQLEN